MNYNDAIPKSLLPFIWHFLKGRKSVVSIYVFLGIIAGFWGPFNNILIKDVIDLLPEVKDGDISILGLPATLIVLNFVVFDNVTWRGIGYIRAKFLPVIINNIVLEMTDHSLKKPNQFYQDNLSGKIAKQITSLADGVIDILSLTIANFLRGASLLLLTFITAYFVNPIFCWVLLVWFLFFASISILMSRKLIVLSNRQAASEAVVVGELVDILSNNNNVRLFSHAPFEKIRMMPFFEKQRRAYYANNIYATILNVIQGGLIAAMMGGCCYFLIYLYGQNLVTVGDFALILGMCMNTGHMMWFTMEQVDTFNQAAGKCRQSLGALMDPIEIKDQPGAYDLNCTKGKITFDHVKFHYKGTEPLFQKKSVEIEAGQKVGLVGHSGGGKSTFVNLILRLYDVTDGAILIDGQNIREVTQESLRQNIAMIPQDPSLFNRTLMENIHYGRLDASGDQIIDAAKQAHAHEFIELLPNGYNSLVGERGVKLSGGQRQRIAIARAILKNAPILILDEATSQLDSVTENLIQSSLWKLMENKTTIVIAHRLSTLLHMDRILVFDKGKIVEDGTHSELIAKAGLYKRLWDAQVGGFLGDGTSKILEE